MEAETDRDRSELLPDYIAVQQASVTFLYQKLDLN